MIFKENTKVYEVTTLYYSSYNENAYKNNDC